MPMHLKTCAAALALAAALAAPAAADCLAKEPVEAFRAAKTLFLSGDYPAFFTLSGATAKHAQEELDATAAQLAAELGPLRSCVDMGTTMHSKEFASSAAAFIGKEGRLVYLYLMALRIEGTFQIVEMKLSTEFAEIVSLLPRR